jgi:hypothetical protein
MLSSCWIWHRVILLTGNNVSEQPTAFIYSEDGDSRILWTLVPIYQYTRRHISKTETLISRIGGKTCKKFVVVKYVTYLLCWNMPGTCSTEMCKDICRSETCDVPVVLKHARYLSWWHKESIVICELEECGQKLSSRNGTVVMIKQLDECEERDRAELQRLVQFVISKIMGDRWRSETVKTLWIQLRKQWEESSRFKLAAL